MRNIICFQIRNILVSTKAGKNPEIIKTLKDDFKTKKMQKKDALRRFSETSLKRLEKAHLKRTIETLSGRL